MERDTVVERELTDEEQLERLYAAENKAREIGADEADLEVEVDLEHQDTDPEEKDIDKEMDEVDEAILNEVIEEKAQEQEAQEQEVGEQPPVEGEKPAEQSATTNEVLAKELAELKATLARLTAQPKNHVPAKVTDKSYERLGDLKTWGKVPQQQLDLANILVRHMELGKKYSEAEVFAFLVTDRDQYVQLRTSRQDVTYLFKYYRGLKKTATHGGFFARDFIKAV